MTRVGVDCTHVSPGGKGHALSQRKAAEGLAGLGCRDRAEMPCSGDLLFNGIKLLALVGTFAVVFAVLAVWVFANYGVETGLRNLGIFVAFAGIGLLGYALVLDVSTIG